MRLKPILLFGLATAALSHAGTLLVSDAVDAAIWKVDTTTSAISLFAQGGPLLTPLGMTIGPNGNVYVSDLFRNQVLEYGTDGTFKGVFATVSSPTNGVFGPNGNFYVTEFNNDDVLELNGTTGALVADVVPTGTVQGADGLAFGPDGNLYVSAFVSNTVTRYTPNGTPLGVFISGPPVNGVVDQVFAPDGSLYLSNNNASDILHYSATGQFLGILGSTAPLEPFGSAISGNELFTGCGCTGTGELLAFDLTTQQRSVIIAPDTPGINDIEAVMVLTPEPGGWLMLLTTGLFLIGLCRWRSLKGR